MRCVGMFESEGVRFHISSSLAPICFPFDCFTRKARPFLSFNLSYVGKPMFSVVPDSPFRSPYQNILLFGPFFTDQQSSLGSARSQPNSIPNPIPVPFAPSHPISKLSTMLGWGLQKHLPLQSRLFHMCAPSFPRIFLLNPATSSVASPEV